MSALWSQPRYGPLPYVFGALLGVSLGLLVISGVLFFNSPRGEVDPAPAQAAMPRGAESIDASRINAIVTATQLVAPAVVSITSKSVRVYRTRSPLPREWLEIFGIPDTYTREIASLGSGLVVSGDGYILTNEHVVRSADQVEVSFATGETAVPATLVGIAHDFDLAVLKVDIDTPEHAQLGDSDDLVVGEWAIAIGQPFGQLLYDTQPTVTVGVISAVHRDVKEDPNSDQYYNDMIQTDAAINPGNSGGPLVNSRGEVIGINTFIFANRGGGNLGMGFAIPSNRCKWVLAEIQEHGRIRNTWLGIRVSTITPELAAGLNLQIKQGLLIREIDHDSPADKANLELGDLILSVNGQKVSTTRQANRIIYGARIGDTLSFEVMRDNKPRTIDVVLEEKPDEI